MEYKITGNINCLEHQGGSKYPNFIYINTKIFNIDTPLMLIVMGTSIPQYLHELYGTDCEEKYMKKRFTYDNGCICTKIEVLDENNKTVKTVDLWTDSTKFLNFIDE